MLFRSLLATLALALVMTPAVAGGQLMKNQLAHLPYEHIADVTSEPGESENAFLLRIGPQLRAYSDKTGFEACGTIGSDGQGHYGVVLGSSHSHLSCVNYPDRVVAGMTATGYTIHSHGKQGVFSMSRNDKLLFSVGADPTETTGLSPDGMDLVMVHGQLLDRFSDSDYESGPGYLATPTGVIFQHGAQTTTVITATAADTPAKAP